MAVDTVQSLIKTKTLGVNQFADKVLGEDGCPEKVLYSKALAINNSQLKKQYVEACLLADGDVIKISNLLEIPVDVIEAYATVFYNLDGLDKLSKLELLNVKDRQESLMKVWAMSQGLDFIAWRLGKPISINPIEGLQDLFTTCVFKSKEAMFSGNESESSKASVQWTKMSLDIARLLKMWVLDNDAAKKDIELALASVEPDFKGFDSLEGWNDASISQLQDQNQDTSA